MSLLNNSKDDADLDLDINSSEYEGSSSGSSDSKLTPAPSTSPQTPDPQAGSSSNQAPGSRSRSSNDLSDWAPATQGDKTSCNFRFVPLKPTGIQPGILPDNCYPMYAYSFIFIDTMVDSLVKSIKTYAERKCQQNNSLRARSRFSTWYPVIQTEVFKFFVTKTLMELDPTPVIKDFGQLVHCITNRCTTNYFLVRGSSTSSRQCYTQACQRLIARKK